jgi:RHH-type proline utilization regulon transcriptional repressor/proline dehydrogenase/delta 1-pyrroline-5-carboxylate dehydrogenase
MAQSHVASRVDRVELRERLGVVAGRLQRRRTLAGVVEEALLRPLLASTVLRVGLFRIVEAYPSLTTPEATLRRIAEELDVDGAPALVRTAVRVAQRLPFGARLARAVASWGIGQTAKRFIAGRDADDALPTVERMWRQGTGVIVDALGEKTVTAAESDNYAARVHDLVTRLGAASTAWAPQPVLEADHHGRLPRVAVAIKPTALSAHYHAATPTRGVDDVVARLVPLLRDAVEHDVFVWLDMEQYEVKDLTHELLRRVADEVPEADLGIVVQAYLRDSYDDLAALVDWADGRDKPLGVRLVKGAYWDAETVLARQHGWDVPVFQQKWASDANYDRCAELMNQRADVLRPAFASHNMRSLARAIAHGQLAGLPQAAPEVEVLHGMAGTLPAGLAALGVRTRVYVPIGELVPGMSYLVRRLLENTSNESFLRQQDVGGASLEALLADPPALSTADPLPTDLDRTASVAA